MSDPSNSKAASDLLGDVMEQVRLEAPVFFSADFAAPYGIAIAREGRAPLCAVRSGTCHITVGQWPERTLRAGDFVVLPGGMPFAVRSGPGAEIVPFDGWIRMHAMDRKGFIRHDGPGPHTRMTGAFFSTRSLKVNPMFAALPPMIHLRSDDPQVQEWLRPTLAFMDAEIASGRPGARTVLRRLAEVLFIQAVRTYVARQDSATRDWLRGITDRRVARALAAIQTKYAEAWTLDSLAREAGMSRTAFAVTFKELIGEPPMAYLQRWRVLRAANSLRTEGLSLARAAEVAGYQSDIAFAKAFKRVTGESPGRYRRSSTPAPGMPTAPAASTELR